MHKRSHFYKTLKSESLKYKIEKTNNAARKKSLTQTRQKEAQTFSSKLELEQRLRIVAPLPLLQKQINKIFY